MALGSALPSETRAQGGENAEDVVEPEDESRWVPSLALTSGVWLQSQSGEIDSCIFANPADATGECPAPGSTPLRPPSSGEDLAISAFVGANLELLSPALPIPTRPRFFVSGEILPTFSADRDVTGEGNPSCVMGPRVTDTGVCVDPTVPRDSPFGEADANGVGSVLTTTYDTLSFGANLGVAFPARMEGRALRIKPSVGWISYAAMLEGKLVGLQCVPEDNCTDLVNGTPGSLRETSLSGSDSGRFHALGPGLDIEMDTGRFGPLGTSIFVGGRAYHTFGDRRLVAEAIEVYGDDGLPLANQAVSARWEAEVDPWIYRVGVGLRLHWLGSTK